MGISFQRTRTWKESTDPDRNAKLDRIEYVTTHFVGRCFAFDQFGPLSIRPEHGSSWAPRKKPARLRATYRRTHGIRYFHGCYCLADDQLWGVTRERKGADHTLAALKSVRARCPDGYRLYVILDNLSANKTPASLGACCVAFGVAGPVVLGRLMAPAASGLLHPGRYAAAVLSGSARLAALRIPFDYFSPAELISVAASVAVAAALAWGYLRMREPRVIRGLRAVHTGSANDYASYAIVGTLAAVAVLSLG